MGTDVIWPKMRGEGVKDSDYAKSHQLVVAQLVYEFFIPNFLPIVKYKI